MYASKWNNDTEWYSMADENDMMGRWMVKNGRCRVEQGFRKKSTCICGIDNTLVIVVTNKNIETYDADVTLDIVMCSLAAIIQNNSLDNVT